MDNLNEIDDDRLKDLVEEFGLPLHIIFTARMAGNADAFRRVVKGLYPETLICFAVKSNPCRGAVRAAARLGLGAEVVSEFELQVALEEGIPPERIVCNGNAKSDRYLEEATRCGALLAVDSIWELELLNRMAAGSNRRVPVMLRFAGMPLEGLTVADQSTASAWTKFGLPVDQAGELFDQVGRLTGIELVGISAHIGTQICDPTGYDRLLDHLLKLAEDACRRGFSPRYFDIGGGFPVSYISRDRWEQFQERLRGQLSGKLPPESWVTWDNLPMGLSHIEGQPDENSAPWRGKAYWSQYPGAAMLERVLSRRRDDDLSVTEKLEGFGRPMLIIEPGRALIGTAGMTVARVAGVKSVLGNNVVILDLGIVNHGTNLVTPDIYPVEVRPAAQADRPVEAFLAGRLCFTGDMISKVKVELNRMPQRGDLVVIHHTGAYSADHFVSNSCGFPRPAKIALLEDDKVELWRQADRFEDVFTPVTEAQGR